MSKKILLSIILAAIIIVVSFLAIHKSSNSSINVCELIERGISKQYKEKVEIDIFDTYEIFDSKIIGFTAFDNKKCSFALLKQKEEEYQLINVQKFDGFIDRGIDIYLQYINLYNEKQELKSYMIILSMNDELSKIEILIDEKINIFEAGVMPYMKVIELPNDDFDMKYTFYDYLENEIK
ncbi:MAG: hypothetical protein GX271_11065 [Clostridiales bacterium]|nr:hypothetical protein [Clostridiales bacterium]